MTNSNDTITITSMSGSSLPAFDTASLSSYLNNMSTTGSYGMSSSMAAGDTITIPSSNYSNYISAYNGTAPLNGANIIGQTYYNTTTNANLVYTGTGMANGWETISNQYYGEEFKDRFPEWNAFRKLCGEYPGLEKAYERLKLCYTMCYADSLLPKEEK